VSRNADIRTVARRRVRAAVALTVGATLAAGACAGDDDTDTSTATATVATTTTVARPDGPAADVSEELTGGNGPFIGAAVAPRFAAAGYVEHEYVAAGTATSYAPVGELTGDGRWTFDEGATAPYSTRIVVRRPADPADFSGTVVVEWLNVSGGLDAGPDYTSLEAELLRRGHAWVGVSAQLIGVEGGPVLVSAPSAEGIAGRGLVGLDQQRYGSLEHPGDAFAFDIYTQVGRAVRSGGAVLGGATPDVVIAAGESQSAIALTTYYNGVQPLTRAFDGFFVHSRASVSLPVVGPGEHADLAGGIGATPTILRTDLATPVFELQAEGDVVGVLNSVDARQSDTETFRLWEVAGTAHADRSLIGPLADVLDCGVPINDGPMHLVAKAAFHHLERWVRTGETPPEAARLEVTEGDAPELVRDDDGIVLGGVRTPPVDVPVDVLSGAPPPSPDVICLLMGSTTPLPTERLAERYESRGDYEQQYEAAADATIAAGFVLEDDRDALVAFAAPDRVPE
jgi:hypothetical protein